MKRYLLLFTAAVITLLASCTKDSELDQSIIDAINTPSAIEFTTYTTPATETKGTAVTTNSQFQGGVDTHGSFKVSAVVCDAGEFEYEYYTTADNTDDVILAGQIKSYTGTPAASATAVTYFNFSSVEYESGAWVNQTSMYWPNYSKIMYFAAYSPADMAFVEDGDPEFGVETDTSSVETYDYTFGYEVTDTVANQLDIMYAMTSRAYLAPSDRYNEGGGEAYITSGKQDTNSEDPVHLHFKHALTQIAFEATKDEGIDVYVKSIKICNVYNSGTFTASALTDDDDADAKDNPTVGNDGGEGDQVNVDNLGTWVADYEGTWAYEDGYSDATTNGAYAKEGGGGYSAMSNYDVPMDATGAISIDSSTTAIALSSDTDVLMLMPQKLTAWVPTTSTSLNYIGSYHTGQSTDGVSYSDGGLSDGEYANPSMKGASRTLSYLAIYCEIYHSGITASEAAIHKGYLFVPFSTENINYSDTGVDGTLTDDQKESWLPGYKITYCLNFGGGYVVEEGDHETLPEPGCIPDTETYTLRPLTYRATVDAWVDVDTEEQDLGYYDTSTGDETSTDGDGTDSGAGADS